MKLNLRVTPTMESQAPTLKCGSARLHVAHDRIRTELNPGDVAIAADTHRPPPIFLTPRQPNPPTLRGGWCIRFVGGF